jgi:hypothetical protein
MKTYNLIYDKSTDLDQLLNQLTSLEVVINQVFSSLGMINITSETENFSSIEGIIGFEEDASIEPVPSLEWHQLRVASRTLPMKQSFIAKNLGEGINIYLVDSGINVDHSEFETSNIVNLYSYNETFDDEIGHGTAIASVIIGKTLGIATQATLKNVKILMRQSIPLSSLLEAFNAVAADKNEDKFAVINCSWTIPKSMILDNLVSDLRAQGFLVVAAAGNTISDADELSPVGYNAVLGVGASDAFDRVISWNDFAGSNFGEEVDLFAPGIDVMVANKDGEISEASGTSISAGIVSGIVAQYIYDLKNGSQDNITIDDIQSTIIRSSQEDILFRNETIYGDTPNRLVMALVLTKYFSNEIPTTIKINQGESFSLQFEIIKKYVDRLNIDNVAVGPLIRHHPDWVILDQEKSTIDFNPPESVETGYYKIYVEFLGYDGNRLMVYDIHFIIGDVQEGYDDEVYKVWLSGESGEEVIVTPAYACTFQGDCRGVSPTCGSTIPSSKTAFCICTYYGPFGNCYSYGAS